MNKTEIKRVIDKLEPSNGMEYRLSREIQQKRNKKLRLKPVISIAASLVMVIGIGIWGNYLINRNPSTSTNKISTEGIYIPKVELPKNNGTGVEMDMIGLIVYQGRIYTETGTKIDSKSAEKLLDEKLGTTKSGIDEFSKQENYAVEFASTIGVQDVYSVKGYDKTFRIMAFATENGRIYNARFYECLNGITVKTGADMFDKLKLDDRINKVRYENYESWNNGKQQFKEFVKIQALNSFINELKNTIPYKQESLSYLFEVTKQKFVYIYLNDGSEVQLRLFDGGYIYYGHLFFKMKDEAFNLLWKELQ